MFKVTGEDTRGALDYFIVEVGPHGGPPLHVHHRQDETIHVLSGCFKVRIDDQVHTLEPRGFAYLPMTRRRGPPTPTAGKSRRSSSATGCRCWGRH